ncbi:hypothetical protein SCUCBS95973_009164 [Sporothrix curviconia]|uniref:Xylanolytic transcriptional activator regulatory domain-containing protein n=1 Tax=Sporothrix curviconia TaxID=1260050 RepID=A0ABP0CVS1_9PEZI
MDSNDDGPSNTGVSTTQADPEQAPVASSSTATAPAQNPLSKRRRGIGVVTPNACNECRKKRVKRDVECVYELPVRQSKEDLRSEIETLRRRQRSSDVVLSALNRPEIWEDVLNRLHHGDTVDSISDWIDTGPQGSAAAGTATSTATPLTSGTMPSQFQRPLPSAYPGVDSSGFTPFSPGLASMSPGMHGQGQSGDPTTRLGIAEQHQHQPQPQQQQHHQHQPHQQQHSYQQHQMHQQHQQQQYQPLHNHPQHMSHLQQHHYQQLNQQHGSPWGGDPYSSTSQAPSTQSDPRQDWNMPPESRVGSWVENIGPDHQQGVGSDGMGGMDSVDFPRYHGVDQVLAPALPDLKSPTTTWTDISEDLNLVQHLLALYFCWEYPTFASLSKEHFLHDFQDGRQRYCSPILVNALLALGCRFSTQPNTRAVPDDPYTSGDHFFKECQRLFYLEDDHHCLTTIQALGIMSIREASCGRDSESWYYAGQSIRLAIEMGLHQIRNDDGDEDEVAVKAATFWGAFALDHELVHQSLYVLHSPGRPLTSRDLLHIYTQYLNWYDSIPEVLRLGHNFTPAVLFAHMYYHFAILLLFRPLIKLRIIGFSATPKDICLQAADAIQGLLRSYSQLYTLQRTPSFVPYFVLTSSIMHLAIGASSSVDIPPGADISAAVVSKGEANLARRPKDGDDHSMRSGSTSSRGGSSAGGGGGGGSGTGYSSPNASRVVKLDPRVVESINRGIADLTEMVPCHHFAEQALNILRYLAKKWNIDVHIAPVTKSPSGAAVEDVDQERMLRPLTTSLNFFSPNLNDADFNCSWGVLDAGVSKGFFVGGSAASASLAKAADNLDNPLFWPFPMQGRPMLPSGKKLEEAGFALL